MRATATFAAETTASRVECDGVWDIAEAHVRSAGVRFGFTPNAVRSERAASVFDARSIDRDDARPQLRRAERRRLGRVTTAVFQQTQFSVPVWGAFFAVQVEHGEALRVVGAQQSLTFVRDLEGRRPGTLVEPSRDDAGFAPGREGFDVLARLVRARTGQRLSPDDRPRDQIFIYRFDERARLGEMETGTFGFRDEDLGPAPRSRDRFVTEVVARAADTRLWWRALIDLEAGAALYLRALAATASPAVLLFAADPVTCHGSSHALAYGPGNWDVELDRYRGQLTPIAVPSDETIMRSEFAEIVDLAPPPLRSPDVTDEGARDDRDRYLPYIRGDYFARATALYHVDSCVRTLHTIGVTVKDLFAPQDLPVKVDPCVESIAGINLATNGITLGSADGVDGICIGELAIDAGTTAAIDPRLVWHEFGHVLLYTRDPRSNGRLPFAHGIGDALSAIHFDPDSTVRSDETRRGLSYPWFENYRPHRIARRHDWRFDEPQGMIWSRVDAGELGEYQREEVLSSTLFRIYRAAGGDSEDAVRRRLASDYVLFLIVQAIGVAKIEAINGPREFRDLLIAADAGIDRGKFHEIPRGALARVIEQAFAEQGLDAWQDDTGRWRQASCRPL